MAVLLKRLVLLLLTAFWLGGLTFYAGVVIPTAHHVLGSHRRVGFITQGVTNWINVAGAVTLATLLWHLVVTLRRGPIARRWRTMLLISWITMAAAQVALFALHRVMDRHLDVETRAITEESQFYGMHRVYLILTMTQQAAGLLQVLCLLAVWRAEDARHMDVMRGP